MEALLKSCGVAELAPALEELGVSSIEEMLVCEVDDLVSDLGIAKEKAQMIVDKANEAQAFEKKKGNIMATWKAVEDSLGVEATKLFYKRLFEQYPSVIPLFSHADMESQAEKLFKTIALAVQYLEDVDTLVPILEEMGGRHAIEYKAERAHYDAVGETLLWTLETGLGEAWTDDVADAWTWVYSLIAKTMADAGDKALDEKVKEKLPEDGEKSSEDALFETRKAAISSTWKAVEDSLGVDATKLFYNRLFEKYPSVVPLFSNADMDSQAEKLFKTVGVAVQLLDDTETLIPVLEDMGKRHASEYKAERAHYDAVGETLLWTLKTGLGEAWTDEVADAWTWVYGLIAKTMADAGDTVAEEEKKVNA